MNEHCDIAAAQFGNQAIRPSWITSGLPVTREQRGSVEFVRSSNECIGDFESTEEAFCCPDFRVTTWALCIDLPASIRPLPN